MSSTTYTPKVNFADIPAAIAAAKGRTGRAPGVIAADWAVCCVHDQDLQARIRQIAAATTADSERTMKKLEAMRIATQPAKIEVAGMLIRRTDPAAEAQAMHNAMMARSETAIAQIKALHERQDAVRALVAELVAELDRAGVPEAEARAWLRKAEVRRVA